MSVAISNIPKISFSQNEMAVTLTSPDYLESEGVKAVYILDMFGPTSSGDYLSLQFENRKIRIDVVLAPDESGYQVPIQGTMTRSEYVLVLVELLKKNYVLSSSFLINVGEDDTVKLTARQPGTKYSILSTGFNLFLTTETEPVDHTVRENFQHYLEVWKGEEKLYESLLPLNYPVMGKTTIDISPIIHASLGLDIPDVTAFWQLCEKSILPFYLRYSNAWGNPSSINILETTAAKYAAFGGYSMMALAHIEGSDHLEKYLMGDPGLYQSQRWFESYPVDDVEVKTNQPQFLYFVNSSNIPETLQLKVIAMFDDQSTSEIILEGGTLNSYEKVCLAVGYKQLGLDVLTTDIKKVVSYNVQLIASDNTPRSVSKNFIVNRCYEANSRYFLFAGSEGNFKTLRTYGSADPNAAIEKESGVLESNEATRIKFGDVVTFDVVSYENEVVSTGYILSRQSHGAIKELMLSKRCFRVIGDKLIPIEITTKEMPLPLELNKTGFVKLEYRLAWDERLYTGDTSALNVPPISQSQQAINDI